MGGCCGSCCCCCGSCCGCGCGWGGWGGASGDRAGGWFLLERSLLKTVLIRLTYFPRLLRSPFLLLSAGAEGAGVVDMCAAQALWGGRGDGGGMAGGSSRVWGAGREQVIRAASEEAEGAVRRACSSRPSQSLESGRWNWAGHRRLGTRPHRRRRGARQQMPVAGDGDGDGDGGLGWDGWDGMDGMDGVDGVGWDGGWRMGWRACYVCMDGWMDVYGVSVSV